MSEEITPKRERQMKTLVSLWDKTDFGSKKKGKTPIKSNENFENYHNTRHILQKEEKIISKQKEVICKYEEEDLSFQCEESYSESPKNGFVKDSEDPFAFLDNTIDVNNNAYSVLDPPIYQSSNCKIFKVLNSQGTTYALKVVHLDPSNESRFEMVRNELERMKQLQHSHYIVQLIDSEETEDTIKILMEYGECNLDQIITKPFNPHLLRYTWHQMINCVHILHQSNIIHGNLQPKSFLLVQGHIKLMDFGLSTTIDPDHTSTTFSTPEQTIYMDPSITSGKISFACDIWSLGIIFYQMYRGIKASMIDLTRLHMPDKFKSWDYQLTKILICKMLRVPSQRPSIQDLLLDPYFVSPSTSFVQAKIPIDQNLKTLAVEIQTKFPQVDFESEECQPIIEHGILQLIRGKQIVFSPDQW